MKKKIRCTVCGSRFHAKKEYMIEKFYTGIAAISATNSVFDAMDCPECGCQFILAERKAKFYPGGACKGGESDDRN